MRKLLALHGHTLSGAHLRRELAHVAMPNVEVTYPDGPLPCTAEAVDRLYAVWTSPRQPPPHHAWFDASDDGRTYHGWEHARALLAPMLDDGPVGLLGFSQGATLAAALAALSHHGELPPLAYVILIAGRTPRADVFAPYLATPIAIPSLHIWGDHDHLVGTTSASSSIASTPRPATW